ncbi:hypothetical protein ACA910_009828 [Epithemia clementina (nom. ined.)]
MTVAATSFRPRLWRPQTAFVVVPNQKDTARPKANFVSDAWFLHTSPSSMITRRQGGTTIPILSTRPPPERQGSSRATVTNVAALPPLQESIQAMSTSPLVLLASFPDVVASSSDTLDRSVDPALLAAPQLSPEAAVGIFLVGLLPFAVATVEFWRRIAVGASFGTGSDSVMFPQNNVTTIGQDNAPAIEPRSAQIGTRRLDHGICAVCRGCRRLGVGGHCGTHVRSSHGSLAAAASEFSELL